MIHRPKIIAVSGFSSNVGKTTLVCDLLRMLPGWEAIKLTRGHYRSCGRDPSGCCVSDLIRDEPLVRSGRDANYQSGKDTGRFWDSGASNVHWVIVKDDQVAQGIDEALTRVEAEGVIVEGNSFLDYVSADLTIMVARSEGGTMKTSARRVLSKCDLVYLSTMSASNTNLKQQFEHFWQGVSATLELGLSQLPIMTREDLPQILLLAHQPQGTLTGCYS